MVAFVGKSVSGSVHIGSQSICSVKATLFGIMEMPTV